jgi:hypothetical protein
MRTQGEKNFSVDMTPFRVPANQPGRPDSLNEEQWNRDSAGAAHANGGRAPVPEAANGHVQMPPIRTELRTPRFSSNGSSDGATIFPYIPRKRQERCGLLVDYLYLPAPDAAGDQVDFLILGENRVGVFLADVSGKAGQESLPIIKTALRSNSAGLSTAATLRYLDQRLCEICANGFAITAFYSIFDQNKRLLHFASAGHLPMLIYRPTMGKVFLLNTAGAPFGAEANGNKKANGALATGTNALKSERVVLRQNDLFVLYSSGLLAARNPQNEFFGRQRLVDFLRMHGDLNPTEFLLELRRVLEKFIGGQPVTDDVTVIVLKNTLRDLEKLHSDANGCELEKRFLTTDEEQAILGILRANPDAEPADILDGLSGGDYDYLTGEQVQAYLAQLRRWLQPWRERNGKIQSKMAQAVTAGDRGVAESPAKKQMQQDVVAAFPLQPLLHRRIESHGGSSDLAQALAYYNNGDYERARSEFIRLLPTIKSTASAHCFLGNLHLLLNAPAKAQHEYLMALKLDSRCVHALLALSYIALLQGDYQTAIDSIATAMRFGTNLSAYQQFAEKLIAAVERLEDRSEWIV